MSRSRKRLVSILVFVLMGALVEYAPASSRISTDNEHGIDTHIRVLLISGASNHDWVSTTPYLKRIFEDTGRFAVDVLEETHSITAQLLDNYDVIVSDFNTFTSRNKAPRDPGWSDETRRAYIEFVRRGGGHVVVHAGSSSFYDWKEYQDLVISSFIVGKTDHGTRHTFPVVLSEVDNPITEGMEPFETFDELWHNAPVDSKATVLASAYSSTESRGSDRYEPVAMVKQYGEGRSFTLILGHDTKSMSNVALQSLLVRGTEWAATGEVTLPLPIEWPSIELSELPEADESLRFFSEDDTFALADGVDVIWQFNHGPDSGKPYFHPLSIPAGPTLTWKNPPDHPWHYGLWFSWKYINQLNFWEEDRKTGRSEGSTTWSNVRIKKYSDHTAQIEMDVSYGVEHDQLLLTEYRVIEVSAPADDGSYYLDWSMQFTAQSDIVLDRTPLPDEIGGKVYGGYAGLSARLASQLVERRVILSEGMVSFQNDRHRSRARAVEYSGLISGKPVGITIVAHPDNLNAPSPWYVIQSDVMSFFSPAVLCYGPHQMAAGESVILRYRVIVHPDRWDAERLSTEYERYIGNRK